MQANDSYQLLPTCQWKVRNQHFVNPKYLFVMVLFPKRRIEKKMKKACSVNYKIVPRKEWKLSDTLGIYSLSYLSSKTPGNLLDLKIPWCCLETGEKCLCHKFQKFWNILQGSSLPRHHHQWTLELDKWATEYWQLVMEEIFHLLLHGKAQGVVQCDSSS